ncbi:MAG: HDIG domain-containing protein [Deltaproteobacteria bacterium]|nr:HDIG domain-containing protein [Deltaproteobacteria bacterium]MBW2083341.1 HDIG domain-containing protein [Deltaproteobacteria bacterium]
MRYNSLAMIPSIDKCTEIMDAYKMLRNIRAHSFVVARVAFVISSELIRRDVEINVPLIVAGALLHDIGKTESLNNGGDHVKIGMKICQEEGLVELVPIVEEHVRLKSFHPKGRILEKEIVYYSDKRVNHDQIVTLEERLSYIVNRYARNNTRLRDEIIYNFNLCKEVEKKLFRPLLFNASDIFELAANSRWPYEAQKGEG